MRIDERLGTFDEVAAGAGALRPALEAVRRLVAELHPDAVEAASRKERSVWWGFGAAKMKTAYAWAMPHARHVNFGFFQGASLPDPEGLLEGTGRALRHVKLRTPEQAGRSAVRDLVIAARDERRGALGLSEAT